MEIAELTNTRTMSDAGAHPDARTPPVGGTAAWYRRCRGAGVTRPFPVRFWVRLSNCTKTKVATLRKSIEARVRAAGKKLVAAPSVGCGVRRCSTPRGKKTSGDFFISRTLPQSDRDVVKKRGKKSDIRAAPRYGHQGRRFGPGRAGPFCFAPAIDPRCALSLETLSI